MSTVLPPLPAPSAIDPPHDAAPMIERSPAAPVAPRPARVAGWLREPLLHFLALGALVFAVDQAVLSRRGDPATITLTAAADAELNQIFQGARGRVPDDAELAALRERWFDNELLYREGLALGLDRGDPAIRERVIFKALNVVQAGLAVPTPTDAQLRAWFRRERARYDEPPRVDFLEAVVAGKPDVDAAAALARMLNRGPDGAGPAEVHSGLRVFKGRPHASVVQAFGAPFADRLSAVPLDTWHVIESVDGPRVVRVEARHAGVPADYDLVREQVLEDWRDRRMQELRTAAVRALGSRYTLRVAEGR